MDATNAALRIVLGVRECEEFHRIRKLYHWPPKTCDEEKKHQCVSNLKRLCDRMYEMKKSNFSEQQVVMYYMRSKLGDLLVRCWILKDRKHIQIDVDKHIPTGDSESSTLHTYFISSFK